MIRDELRSSLIVRVRTGRMGMRILVHNLHTQEMLELKSWSALVHYLRTSAKVEGLR